MKKFINAVVGLSILSLCFSHAVAADLNEVADRFMIQDLMNRYAMAHDLTDPEDYAGVFTSDGELIIGGAEIVMAKGYDELFGIGVNDRKRFNEGVADDERSFGFMRHVITNSVVSLNGDDTATGVCYVTTVVQDEETGGPVILSIGRYEDEYVKENDEWLISKRRIFSDMGNSILGSKLGLGGG